MAATETATHDRVPPATQRVPLRSWWILTVLFTLYLLSFVDRAVISMLVPDIKASLQLSDTEMGLILGPAFAIFYSLFGIPLGWVGDNYPRRWVIFIGSVVFGLATAASALAESFMALFLARVLVGIGEASLSPAAYSLMADTFPRNRLGTASAIYNTAAKLGTASAYTVGGLAVGLAAGSALDLPGLGQMEAWRMVFLIAGVPTVLAACLMFTFAEPPRTLLTQSGNGANIFGYLKAERKFLVPMLIGFSLMAVCSFGLAAWAPAYISRRFGWSAEQYGPVLGAVSMAAALTLVFKGALVDWLYTRGGKDAYIRFYTWMLACCIPIAAATFFVEDAVLFMIGYGVIQIVALPTAIFIAAAMQQIVPGNLRGQIISVFFVCMTVVGGTIGPMFVAGFTDYVFRDEAMVGYSMAVVVGTMMPLAYVFLRRSLTPYRDAVLRVEAADRGV